MDSTIGVAPGVRPAGKGAGSPARPPRERQPFSWLEPARQLDQPLTAEAQVGLPRLQQALEPAVPTLIRGLLQVAVGQAIARRERASAPSTSVSLLNRRRRAAIAWLRAIAAGAVNAETLGELVRVWAPTLAGTGPDARSTLRCGRTCIEYLRGAITGLVLTRPEDNLVPEARALFALESILARHLKALYSAAEGSANPVG